MVTQFEFSGAYATLTLHSASEQKYHSDWTHDHYRQGFCIRPESMAFGTPTDEPYDVTITDEVDANSLLPEAIFAVRVPFLLTDDEACISDNFVSSRFPVPAGITHVCFLVMPNCRVFFILESAPGAVDSQLLRPIEYLPKRDNFLLTADRLVA